MTDHMPEVTVTTAPPLITVPAVELMHTGQWPISTGIANFTPGDLQNAVAALACPAVRRPVLKLGHSEPDPDEHGVRWDGEPAVGYITNMAVVENGQTLIGDYAGMPSWLGNGVLASAYPDRSIEGQYDFRCQIGHTHPFVITAVALLGVTAPGIGTLQSLQDVAALFGATDAGAEQVAAAAPDGGPSFTLTVHAARQEASMPNPNPTTVRAGVTTDDVRRAFYDSDYGKGWDIWICEIQLGPTTQLIVIDDSTGKLQRVPVTIADGDGEDAVEFGEPVAVVVRYEDAQVAASAGRQVVAYASREESRPGQAPAESTDAGEVSSALQASAGEGDAPPNLAAQARPEPPQDSPPVRAGAITHQEGAAMDAVLLREALGLSPEASDDEVRAALTDQGVTPAQPTDPNPEPAGDPGDGGEGEGTEGEGEGDPAGEPATQQVSAKSGGLPPGTVAIDETTLNELRQQAQQGVAARAQQKREDRDRTLAAAVSAGKFPPARREHWEAYWDRDEEGARQALASLAPGLVPVEDAGAPGGEPTETFDDVDRLFSTPVPKGA